MKELMLEIISELLKLSIPELEIVKKEWISEMETKGISEPLVKLCQAAVGLVIEKKREKEGAHKTFDFQNETNG